MQHGQVEQGGAEYLAVRVAGQQFALDIMSVREIRGWTSATPLPHAPVYVLGMINIRGAVLPVIDMAARMALGSAAKDPSAVVVVIHIQGRQIGLLVEAVLDILTVTPDMLQAAPDVGAQESDGFVRGLMTTEAGIVTILSLDEVLPPPQTQAA